MKILSQKQNSEIENFLKNYKSKYQFRLRETYLYQFIELLKKNDEFRKKTTRN
jgi:hypothetical protein